MLKSKRRWLLVASLLCILEVFVLVSFAQPRGAVIRTLLGIYLKTKGMQLARADIALDTQHLHARNVLVLDRNGLPTISAASLIVRYQWHGAHVDLQSIDLEQPRLVIRRAADGSFPIASLSGGATGGGGGNAQSAPSLHALLRLHDGTLNFENRFAPGRSGRAFSLQHVSAIVRFAQGAVSTGWIHAVLATQSARAALAGTFTEDDVLRLAQLHLTSRHVPIGPLLNYFVSSTAFVVEDGSADLDVRGYAIGWQPNSSPVWALNARGMFYNARFRVIPLIVPVRAVSGPFTLADNVLGLPRFSGLAAGLPVIGHGAISMQPSMWLDLKVGMQGPLELARNLLAFSKPIAVRGGVALATHIVGQPTNPHIGVAFAMPNGWLLAQTPVGRTSGMLLYNSGHLTLPFATAFYEGLTVRVGGDIDVGAQGPPSGELIAYARGPARAIPWIANVDRHGLLGLRATFEGPLAQLAGSGFIQLRGQRTNVRATFSGEPTLFRLGPVLAQDVRGGSLMLRAEIGRAAPRALDGAIVADHFHINLNNQRTALPGVFNHPYGTPQVTGTIEGTAAASGVNDQTLAAAQLALADTSFDGRPLGELDVSTQLTATMSPRMQGLAAVQLQHRPNGGSRAGSQALAAVVGLHDHNLSVYAANARVGGGAVSLSGDMHVGRVLPQTLIVAANRLKLNDLGLRALADKSGEVTALGHLEHSASRSHATLAAVGNNLRISGSAVSGDADLHYDGATVASENSRLLIGGSALALNGKVHGISPSLTAPNPSLDLRATIRDGDVGQLSSLAAGAGPPLTGIVDGDVHIGGSPANPNVVGNVASDAGTIRGVTYRNMRAHIAGTRNDITVNAAQATIGKSRLLASAELRPGATTASIATPQTDLSDFNDFFGGKDVLHGQAHGALGVRLAGSATRGSGQFNIRDFAFEDVPFGTVSATLQSPRASAVELNVRQHGIIGSSSLAVRGDFSAVAGARITQLPHSFDVTTDLRGIDVSMLEPLLPAVAEGVRGSLDAHVDAQRHGGSVRGQASLALAHGFIGKRPVNDLHISLAADNHGVSVREAHANTTGLDITARGHYGWDRTVAANTQITAADMADAERLAELPSYVTGPAQLNIAATGSLARPVVDARFESERGTVEGIRYSRAAMNARYAASAVTVHDASLTLPNGGGIVHLTGQLPLFAGPHPPNARVASPLALNLDATSVDLAALDPLLQKHGSLEGRLNLRAGAKGSLAHPVLSGNAQVRGGVVRTDMEKVPLTRLDADMIWNNNTLALQRLHGTLGKGTVDAQGTARLQGPPGGALTNVAYDAQVALRKANVTIPNLFSGVVDVDAGLHTKGADPSFTSNIVVSDSDIPFSGILALASGSSSGEPPQAAVIPGVPQYQPGHHIFYGGTIYGPSELAHQVQPTPRPLPHNRQRHLAPIALDVNATAGDNVQTTGLVSATGEGTVHIGGTMNAPSLNGEITTVRGEVAAFDTTFHLMRGDVRFHPTDGFLPTIDAEAVAYRPEADVTVTVFGRVDQLHTDFSSDPPMSTQDILANMLHINDINNSLSGGGTGGGAPSLTKVAGNVLTGKLMSAMNYGLERTLHVEEIDLGFDQNGQPTLELRKQYGKNLYALYRTSFATPPQQEVGMAYTLRHNLEIEWIEKQNTAGQSQWQQGQYTTWTALYRIPNEPSHHRHHPVTPEGQRVNIGP